MSWGCAAGSLNVPRPGDDGSPGPPTYEEWGTGWSVEDSSVGDGIDAGVADDSSVDSGALPCQPSCAGKTCGASDGCGGTCSSGSGCCAPSCGGKPCGASDGCGGTCSSGSGCCTPSCAGKSCGASDGCGGTCSIGSGCSTTCATWQAANPDDPWDDSDPNYDGERKCNGSVIKDFGTVSTEAACRTKCGSVGATCCARDHRAGHKSCQAYDGKVVVMTSCTGCTAATCK